MAKNHLSPPLPPTGWRKQGQKLYLGIEWQAAQTCLYIVQCIVHLVASPRQYTGSSFWSCQTNQGKQTISPPPHWVKTVPKTLSRLLSFFVYYDITMFRNSQYYWDSNSRLRSESVEKTFGSGSNKMMQILRIPNIASLLVKPNFKCRELK